MKPVEMIPVRVADGQHVGWASLQGGCTAPHSGPCEGAAHWACTLIVDREAAEAVLATARERWEYDLPVDVSEPAPRPGDGWGWRPMLVGALRADDPDGIAGMLALSAGELAVSRAAGAQIAREAARMGDREALASAAELDREAVQMAGIAARNRDAIPGL